MFSKKEQNFYSNGSHLEGGSLQSFLFMFPCKPYKDAGAIIIEGGI